jgi:hypothetical protein
MVDTIRPGLEEAHADLESVFVFDGTTIEPGVVGPASRW